MPVRVQVGAGGPPEPGGPDGPHGRDDRPRLDEDLDDKPNGDAPNADVPDLDALDADDQDAAGAPKGQDGNASFGPKSAPDKDFGALEGENFDPPPPPHPVDPLEEEAAALLLRWPFVIPVGEPSLYHGPFDGGVGVVPALTEVPSILDPEQGDQGDAAVEYQHIGAAFATLSPDQQEELNGALVDLIAKPEDEVTRQRMALRLHRLAEAVVAARCVPLAALLAWVALCTSPDLDSRVPAALHSLLCFGLANYRRALHKIPHGAPPERFRRLIVLALSRVPRQEFHEWFLAAPDDFRAYLDEHLRLVKSGVDAMSAIDQAVAHIRAVRTARASAPAREEAASAQAAS